MRLFFDENIGRGVPEALRLVGIADVDYVTHMFRDEFENGQGVTDEEWIPRIGNHWLVISKDQGLLRKPTQARLLAAHRVGLICITTPRVKSVGLLAFMLRRMAQLEEIDATVARPFAFRVSMRGPFRQVPLPDPDQSLALTPPTTLPGPDA